MTRKTIVELQTELATLLPDNTTGAITPAALRTMIGDFLNTMTPAYGGIQITGAGLAQVLNIAPAPLVFQSELVAQLPEFATVPGTGTVRRQDTVTTNSISFNMDVQAPANRQVTATLYADGVATPWRGVVQGTGAADPVVLSFEATHYSAVPVNYQVFVNANANATSVTFSNAVFLVNAVPVRTA